MDVCYRIKERKQQDCKRLFLFIQFKWGGPHAVCKLGMGISSCLEQNTRTYIVISVAQINTVKWNELQFTYCAFRNSSHWWLK
jgi:hypothetical protein